jgi:ribosomal protein S18 acetylase RimI-like enzyme
VDRVSDERTAGTVRRADVQDAAELVRLRLAMFAAMGQHPERFDDTWIAAAERHFRARLAESNCFAAFVVDGEDRIAATAVGWLDRHLPSLTNPSGLSGYVANISTDAGYRRRGYARSVLQELLEWFRGRGVQSVDLDATPEGEPLYRSLGFTEPQNVFLTLPLRHDQGS